MHDPSKPDLEESVNVTEAHDRVLRGAAAVSRENKLNENGDAPLSLWVTVLCAIPVCFAGWTAFGYGTPLFSYKDTVRSGYVQVIPSGGEDEVMPPESAVAAYSRKGGKIFGSKCQGCHGADGKGDGNQYPSLVGSKFAQGESERFSQIILNGLTGPTSYGKVFGVMPSQAPLTADELACVMTYVRNNMGNKVGDVISKAQAAEALKISAGRAKAGTAVTADELDADHKKTLPGAILAADTMVDPVTLEPVAK